MIPFNIKGGSNALVDRMVAGNDRHHFGLSGDCAISNDNALAPNGIEAGGHCDPQPARGIRPGYVKPEGFDFTGIDREIDGKRAIDSLKIGGLRRERHRSACVVFRPVEQEMRSTFRARDVQVFVKSIDDIDVNEGSMIPLRPACAEQGHGALGVIKSPLHPRANCSTDGKGGSDGRNPFRRDRHLPSMTNPQWESIA